MHFISENLFFLINSGKGIKRKNYGYNFNLSLCMTIKKNYKIRLRQITTISIHIMKIVFRTANIFLKKHLNISWLHMKKNVLEEKQYYKIYNNAVLVISHI